MSESLSCIEIIDFEPALAADFERLNREWLEALFTVEPIDARILADPQRYILDPGGHILFARSTSEIVGTAALKHAGDGRYELTKMAVTPAARGLGAGRQLAEAVVARFRELHGSCLYLESHSSLAPALALYESLGFRHRPRTTPSEYARADVYMVYEA